MLGQHEWPYTDVVIFMATFVGQTCNHYLKSVKQFTRWMGRDRRLPDDPLAYLSRMNVSVDRRHDRRALSADEFSRLVEAARTGPVIESAEIGLGMGCSLGVATWPLGRDPAGAGPASRRSPVWRHTASTFARVTFTGGSGVCVAKWTGVAT